jgi:hypothetical protein
MPFTFNTGNIAQRFTNPAVENEIQITTNPVSGRWHITADVVLRVYTPRGADGQYALCYIDARPSFETRAEFSTGSVNDTNATRGRDLTVSIADDFVYPGDQPQTFWFMANIGASGPGSWVELRRITGTATELP